MSSLKWKGFLLKEKSAKWDRLETGKLNVTLTQDIQQYPK